MVSEHDDSACNWDNSWGTAIVDRVPFPSTPLESLFMVCRSIFEQCILIFVCDLQVCGVGCLLYSATVSLTLCRLLLELLTNTQIIKK